MFICNTVFMTKLFFIYFILTDNLLYPCLLHQGLSAGSPSKIVTILSPSSDLLGGYVCSPSTSSCNGGIDRVMEG